MTATSNLIIALDKARMDAMGNKDVDKLNEILGDDLIYTHSSARLDSKQSLIGAMQSGDTVYESVVPSNVQAQDLGDTVVLTGVARITIKSTGAPNAFTVRFTDVYTKRSGGWQMVAWQSTKVVA